MKALICGVSGQDGALLAEFLLKKNYEVFGTSRDASLNSFNNLIRLGIVEDVQKFSMAMNDFHSVLHTINTIKPDEIYNLAGQSSVSLSFEQPVETLDSIAGGTLNLLEAIRFNGCQVRFYNAGSCECFGNTGDKPADEETQFLPRSPYGVAKASAFWMANNYRTAYNLYACTGILFNHESELRPSRFVTQKIVQAAAKIASGKTERLRLGNIDIKRDWGFAPEYVQAMWLMLQLDQPEDFVIATGNTVSLEYFIETTFKYFDLNWKDHVESDKSFLRPADIPTSRANPAKANKILKLKSQTTVEEVIHSMCLAAKQTCE